MNNLDAVVVREGLRALAGYTNGDTGEVPRFLDTLGIAQDECRSRLAAARLTSIAEGINGELPPDLRKAAAKKSAG